MSYGKYASAGNFIESGHVYYVKQKVQDDGKGGNIYVIQEVLRKDFDGTVKLSEPYLVKFNHVHRWTCFKKIGPDPSTYEEVYVEGLFTKP